MGGLGKTAIASAEATKEERDAATKPHGQLGIGVERRFERFALQAELRWITIGKDHDHGGTTKETPPMPSPPPNTTSTGNPPPTQPTTPTMAESTKLEGGQFTIGLSYYF